MKPKAKLSNDEAEELVRQGWSSPENTTLLKERMDELQARADRAEACCAEMRYLIELTFGDRQDLPNMHPGHIAGEFCFAELRRAIHALSTDCGKGWLSPEKAKELEARILFLESAAVCYEARIAALKARNQRLREALELLMDLQNGPPLLKWKDQWEACMEQCKTLLAAEKEQA